MLWSGSRILPRYCPKKIVQNKLPLSGPYDPLSIQVRTSFLLIFAVKNKDNRIDNYETPIGIVYVSKKKLYSYF